MYVLISTLTDASQMTLTEAKNLCLRARGEGKRSEILSEEEAKRRGILDPMQDLTKITDWTFIR